MEKRYAEAIAGSTGRAVSDARQMLRALREADLVPGHGIAPKPEHVARIILALSADLQKSVAPTVAALQDLTVRTNVRLPPSAGGMLTLLVETLPRSPVFGDFDLDDGFLHFSAESVNLECLTLAGHRACVRYGAPFEGIAHTVTIPISTVRSLIAAVKDVT
jgi:hypothetical protein